jgi:hypothetical protein
MSAFRQSVAVILSCLLLARAASAQDQPGPPQPPLTNATLEEWREELSELYGLRDNEFLYEEASLDFSRRVAPWEGAEAVLNLEVTQVTKEAVICESLRTGLVTIRSGQEPVVPRRDSSAVAIGLRVGDVIPLEVARRLREGDQIAVRGVVAASEYQPTGPLKLAIAKARAVAVVARTYSRGGGEFTAIASAGPAVNYKQLLKTPVYPAAAVSVGADGEAVVTVADQKLSLAKSAGNPWLDEAVMQAMQRLRNNTHMFPGEHRFTFTILR